MTDAKILSETITPEESGTTELQLCDRCGGAYPGSQIVHNDWSGQNFCRNCVHAEIWGMWDALAEEGYLRIR